MKDIDLCESKSKYTGNTMYMNHQAVIINADSEDDDDDDVIEYIDLEKNNSCNCISIKKLLSMSKSPSFALVNRNGKYERRQTEY